MLKTARIKMRALLVAAFFMIGNISVCLHGPDDHHYHATDALCGHDDGHADDAGHPDTDGHDSDCGSNRAGHDSDCGDHHLCPCISHMALDVSLPATTYSAVSLTRTEPDAIFDLLAGFVAEPYRPPITC